MGVWRYCPNCYRLADSTSRVRFCPMPSCIGTPNNRLQPLPVPPEAAMAATKVGGAGAVETMVVAALAGDEAAAQYEPAEEEIDIESTFRGFRLFLKKPY